MLEFCGPDLPDPIFDWSVLGLFFVFGQTSEVPVRFHFRAYFLLIFSEYKILMEAKIESSVISGLSALDGADRGRWYKPANSMCLLFAGNREISILHVE